MIHYPDYIRRENVIRHVDIIHRPDFIRHLDIANHPDIIRYSETPHVIYLDILLQNCIGTPQVFSVNIFRRFSHQQIGF